MKYWNWKKHISMHNLLILILGVFVLIITWIRLYYGVELTDEAYYVAEARLIARGAVPFATNWSTSGSPLLYFWLVSLYESFYGNTEGLFLFMRQAYLVIKASLLSIVFILMRKKIKSQILVLFLLSLFPIQPFNISMFSYNSTSLLLLLLGEVLIISVLLNHQHKYGYLLSALAGLCMMLCTLAYPTQAINAAFLGICFLLYLIRDKKSILPAVIYGVSGISSGIIVLFGLSIAGGGWFNLIYGLQSILQSPYFTLGNTFKNTGIIVELYPAIVPVIAFLIIFCLSISCQFFKNRKERNKVNSFKHSTVIALILSEIAFIVYVCAHFSFALQIINTISSCLFFFPLLFLPFIKNNRKLCNTLLLFIWFPGIISMLITSLFSRSGISQRWYIIAICSILSIVFSYFALQETLQNETSPYLLSRHSLLPTGLSIAFIIAACISSYNYVYRDNPIPQLSHRVNQGVYKGIYSTPSRGKDIVLLEDEIRKHTSADETILFMDAVPMAYLMTDATFLTPTTWDSMQYTYGCQSDQIMQKYFSSVGSFPDKIVYIYTGRDEVLSIESEAFDFNDFVSDHYNLVHENDQIYFRIKIYQSHTIISD